MIAEIKFDCAHCGQRIAVEPAAAGLSADCPNCGHDVTIPQSISTSPRRSRVRHTENFDRATPPPRSSSRDNERIREGSDRVQLEHSLQSASAELAVVREQLEATLGECERLSAAATAAHAELKTFQAERAALRQDLSYAKQRTAFLESQLAARESERDGTLIDLTVAQQRAAAAETQLAVKEEELEQLLTALEEANALQEAATADLEMLHDESALLRTEVDRARQTLVRVPELEAQLRASEEQLRGVAGKLGAAETKNRRLTRRCAKLKKEAAQLEKDLSETSSGRELLDLRSKLTTTETERHQLAVEVRQLNAECARAGSMRSELEQLLRETRLQLGEVERRAEATCDSRLGLDNELLRGIISRQNAELERRLAELNRFRRAGLALKIIYGLFALGLVGLGAFLLHILPQIQL